MIRRRAARGVSGEDVVKRRETYVEHYHVKARRVNDQLRSG